MTMNPLLEALQQEAQAVNRRRFPGRRPHDSGGYPPYGYTNKPSAPDPMERELSDGGGGTPMGTQDEIANSESGDDVSERNRDEYGEKHNPGWPNGTDSKKVVPVGVSPGQQKEIKRERMRVKSRCTACYGRNPKCEACEGSGWKKMNGPDIVGGDEFDGRRLDQNRHKGIPWPGQGGVFPRTMGDFGYRYDERNQSPTGLPDLK